MYIFFSSRLYIVLIKSKQDELKSLQPLEPFCPIRDIFGISDKSDVKAHTPLTAKHLIQKYQLEKSQLAFTYCSRASDGMTPVPQWNTTIFSTVLTGKK